MCRLERSKEDKEEGWGVRKAKGKGRENQGRKEFESHEEMEERWGGQTQIAKYGRYWKGGLQSCHTGRM